MSKDDRLILSRLLRHASIGGTETCWWWTAAKGRGYGRFHHPITQRQVQAHRAMYEVLRGPISAGLTIDHLCRNRACINPKHMEPVSNRTNILRGVGHSAANARKTHCPRGHAYDEENTMVRGGKRHCRKCEVARVKRWRAARAALSEEPR